MKKFSILVPSRNRVPNLERLLRSIDRTTRKPDSIEVIISIDFDDAVSVNYISKIFSEFSVINPKIIVRKQSKNLSDDYYNEMCRLATGEYLWVMNDDCEIKTNGWDVIFLNKLSEFGKKIFYGDVGDSTRNFQLNGLFSCFPLLSRESFNTLGYFFNPEIRTWAADKMLHKLYEGTGRILDLTDVFVMHHRETKGESFDRMKTGHSEDNERYGGSIIHMDISADKRKLKENMSLEEKNPQRFMDSMGKRHAIVVRSQFDCITKVLRMVGVKQNTRLITMVTDGSDSSEIKYPIRRLEFLDYVVLEQLVRSKGDNKSDVLLSKIYKRGEVPKEYKVEVEENE